VVFAKVVFYLRLIGAWALFVEEPPPPPIPVI